MWAFAGREHFLGHIFIKVPSLLQIFMDMAVLVDAQGDLLDNIESQVIELLFNDDPSVNFFLD